MTDNEVWGAEHDWDECEEWEEYREENRGARQRYVLLAMKLRRGESLGVSEVEEMEAFVASTTASV